MSQEVEKTDNFKNCHYDRCCKPLKLDHHIKKNGLVKVSKKIRDIYTHLNNNELGCTSCRKTIYKLDSNPKSISQTDLNSFYIIYKI